MLASLSSRFPCKRNNQVKLSLYNCLTLEYHDSFQFLHTLCQFRCDGRIHVHVAHHDRRRENVRRHGLHEHYEEDSQNRRYRPLDYGDQRDEGQHCGHEVLQKANIEF